MPTAAAPAIEPVLPPREAVRRPGRPRSLTADRAILDAALSLVRETGYRAVTIEAVAARAGVGRPTLYRRYADRTALFIAVYDRFAADERFDAPSGDPEADIAALLTRLFELFERTGLVAVLAGLVVDAQASAEDRTRLLARLVEPRRRIVGAIVAAARRRGRVRRDVSADAVADHVAAIVWFRILAGGGTLDATFAAETAALVVRGLAPR
jgi:AcrR family transcriptional regulator